MPSSRKRIKKRIARTKTPLPPWWGGDIAERYWMEITSRDDIGVNLKAPQRNEKNQPYWGYSLINQVKDGDVVLHYDQKSDAIVGYSFATGQVWEEPLVWVARGTSARKDGSRARVRDGWYLGLEGYTELLRPVTHGQLVDAKAELLRVRTDVESERGKPSYFPFTVYKRQREPSPQQAYLTKFPRALLPVFEQLHALDGVAVPPVQGGLPIGAPVEDAVLLAATQQVGTHYRPADERMSVGKREPFAVDPSIVERGLQSHAATQNALAGYIESLGMEPRSPKSDEPNFDLAWKHSDTWCVAEVKSITEANEEKQLRLGLGQVLRYMHVMQRNHRRVRGFLVVEREPIDESWLQLCRRVGVTLMWKGNFPRSLDA